MDAPDVYVDSIDTDITVNRNIGRWVKGVGCEVCVCVSEREWGLE